MDQKNAASRMFSSANKLMEAYHVVLQPLCREMGLPPMAVDILMFFANNPDYNTAKDICQRRGMKSGIVSVHIERLVTEGLLERRNSPGDRRKCHLVCTEAATPLIEKGHRIQKEFAGELLAGLSESDLATLHICFDVLCSNIDRIRKNGLDSSVSVTP